MGKGAKILGTLFLLLGIASIGLYFFMGDKFNNFKVVFNSNGGTPVSEQVIKKGEKATKPADPTKENSEFLGWNLDGNAYNFDTVVTKDMTLIAGWNDIVFRTVKVTIDGADYTATVRDGENVTMESLNIPAKEGYLIKIYNENNEEYNISNPVTADLNLTAQYIEIITRTVKFNSNGGSKVEDIKVNDGLTITEPTATKDGYILDGWYLGEQKFDFTTPITKDITLKARWNDGPKINVIFMVDGKVYKTVPTKENTAVSKPSNPTKKGYKFVEWQKDGVAFDFNTAINEDITLKAKWEIEKPKFTVKFNNDDNTEITTKTVEEGSKVSKPTNPTKDGYKFVDWLYNHEPFNFDTPITQNIVLTARYEKINSATGDEPEVPVN